MVLICPRARHHLAQLLWLWCHISWRWPCTACGDYQAAAFVNPAYRATTAQQNEHPATTADPSRCKAVFRVRPNWPVLC
jgi:hypothetical protein